MEKSSFEKRLTCSDCKFFDTVIPAGALNTFQICRFNPPIVAHAFSPGQGGALQVISQSIWPQMGPTDWCGKLETRAN